MRPFDQWLAGAPALRLREGRPLVTVSFAQSLDGSIAARPGEPLELSSPATWQLTHRLRAVHDAILVGIGTVLADDPRLTVRLVEGPNPQPVILDSHLRIPLKAKLLHQPLLPWIIASESAPSSRQARLEGLGARVVRLPEGDDGRVALIALLAYLGEQGVDRLMVEGGATVISAFLSQGLADLLVITIAPLLVGGVHALRQGSLSSVLRLGELRSERYGDDLVIWGRIRGGPD